MKRTLVLLAFVALAACASAIKEAPPQGNAYADFLVGRVATLRDDHAAAADRYFAALARAPATPELIAGALNSSLAGGDIRRAETAARLAKEAGADFAMARIVRATRALANRRWGQAHAETRELDGDALEALVGRMIAAWAQSGERRTDEGVAQLEAIGSEWRQISGITEYQRAMMFELAGQRDAAVAAYASARESRTWLPPAAVRELDLLARMGRADGAPYRGDASLFEPALARAVAALEASQPVSERPLTHARAAAIGLYGLGSVLIEEEDFDRGLSLLTLTLMLDPQLDTARLRYAEAQRDLGRLQSARAALDAIGPESPYAEAARVSTAWILRREERGDEAVVVARTAAAAGGGRLARVSLGDLLRSLERWQDADAAYTQIIDTLGEPQADDWYLFFARGSARERMGNWDLAEADVRRALELSPDQPEALNFLGYGWVDRGQKLEEGLTLIQRAVALRPQSGHIIDSLGWAYFRIGEFQQALDHLERAVELEPADPTLNDHLGDALWRLGRRVEARYQWNRALSLKPSATERAAIENKLAHGLPPIERAASAAR